MTADSQSPTVSSPEAPKLPLRWRQVIAASRTSLYGAAVLFCLDVVVDGSYLFSILVCPIWFLISAVKNLIGRPRRAIALLGLRFQP